jgi:hypothetical protein
VKTLRLILVFTFSLSVLALFMALVLASSGAIDALAATNLGPVLSIPSGIPASSNSTVTIPVQFTSNTNLISSMIFSVDYSNTYLQFDPTLPFSITMVLPAGFSGDCTYDLADLDGEIDCFILDPLAPLNPLPDGVIASIKLTTGSAAPNTTAVVGFSVNSPPASFGNTSGQSVAGSTVSGSVLIDQTAPTEPSPEPTEPPVILDYLVYFPTIINAQVSGCSNLVANSSFETNSSWLLQASDYTAQYTTLTAKTGAFSMQTGIYDPKHNVYSYSSARQFVTIPGDATSATLNFYRLLFRDELVLSPSAALAENQLPAQPIIGGLFPDSVTLDEDVQMALILDAYGYTQSVLLWTIQNNAVWVNENFNLIDFAGETIQLYFGTFNNGELKNSAMFIDDVTLTVCR